MPASGNKQPVVFFGTGPVAAQSLSLLNNHQEIEAVVTKPKPEGHKGAYPVIDVATQLKIPILYVTNKREVSKQLQASGLKSTLAVLIDFGIIVDTDTINHFPLGIINSHFSRLPEWRGADPISFAILNGQSTTAVSLMLVDEGMDTGKLLTQKGLHIANDDTTPSLTKKLIQLSDDLLREYIPLYFSGNVKPRQQPHPERATYSRKLTKVDGLIDWSKPAEQIEREIRAYIDWPKSYTKLATKDVVITASKLSNYTGEVGTVVLNKNELHICCGLNSLQILRIKPAGKKEMTAEAFLAGHRHLLQKKT